MASFEHIEYLLGGLVLVPLGLLWLYMTVWKKNAARRLGDAALVRQLIRSYSPARFHLKTALAVAAIALGILSLANLRRPLKTTGSRGSGVDVMIALDVSRSMLSQDEKPTRLDKARQLINRLTDAAGSNRIGLVVFAGQAYLQMPLTADASATKMFVSDASPEMVSVQGTNLAAALQLCDASLDTREKKYKAVVVITDGEDHEPQAVETAKQLADHGVVIYTVGVGSPEGAPITEAETNEYKKDENGQTIISKLNAPLLKDIAAAANGTFFLLEDVTATADALAAHLDGMEKKQIGAAGGFMEYQLFYPWLLALAVAALIAETFIPEKRKLAV